jgi:hypothetical protein
VRASPPIFIAAQSDAYVGAIDAASDRVVSGVLGQSVQGRPLRYAIVGRPERVTGAGLAAVRATRRTTEGPASPPGPRGNGFGLRSSQARTSGRR